MPQRSRPNVFSRHAGRAALAAMVLLLAYGLVLPASGAAGPSPTAQRDAESAERAVSDASDSRPIVKCALPVRVDRLGTRVTKLGAQRITETSPEECRSLGGELLSAGATEPSATTD